MQEVEVLKKESLPGYSVGSYNDLRPSAEALKGLGDFLLERLNKLKEFRMNSGWDKEKADGLDAYQMVEKKRQLPFTGASNMSSILSRIGVDSYHANVMGSFYGNGNELKVKPVVTNKAFANSGKKAADYMTYVMNQEAKFYNVLDDADKKAQMYSIGYMEPCYEKEEIWETVEIKETVEIPEQDPFTGEVIFRTEERTRTEKKKKTVFDGIRIYSLPVESVYKNPFFTTLEQCVKEDAVFKVFDKPYSYIKERTKKDGGRSYFIKSQVDLLEPLVTDKINRKLNELEQARAKVDGFYQENLSRQHMVKLAQGYTWYDIDGDGIREEITAVFDSETGIVIRVTLAKCRIREIIPRPRDERGYGDSIPSICKVLDQEWENFHNTRANAGQWENTTFGFYRAGGRLNPQQITIQPGRFYPVDDPREVQFANIPRVGTSFFQEEGLILNYFERIFALDENIQGISSKGTQTATETLRVSNKASVRFANPFNRTVSAINLLLEDVWELSQECAPPDKEFFVIGEGGVPVFDNMTAGDFNSKMKFSVEVSSVFDQQLLRDTWLLTYRLYISNPYVMQHPEILWDLSQKTLNELGVKISLPKPPQANVLSPFEEHEMAKHGEFPEPEVGEDTKFHKKIHMMMLQSPDFKNMSPEFQNWLKLHIDKTTILERTLESANLNRSGMYTGGPMPEQPGLTANRNPSQMFNTMRVGESGKSSVQNVQNGVNGQGGGANVEQTMDKTFGNAI